MYFLLLLQGEPSRAEPTNQPTVEKVLTGEAFPDGYTSRSLKEEIAARLQLLLN